MVYKVRPIVIILLLSTFVSTESDLKPSESVDDGDLQGAESIGKAYSAGGLDEGYHEAGGKQHFASHHGEKAAGHGHREDFHEAGHLKKGKGGSQAHDVGSHHKEAGSSVGHHDSKAAKKHDKVLKHTWDRGGGFVKKWHWDKGAHLEEEHSDAHKKHLEHKGQHHHSEAGKRSKGKKADHQHHKEAHKKEHHKANHGHEKNLQSGQHKESAHHEKNSKKKHHQEHDDGHKWGGWGKWGGSPGYSSGWDKGYGDWGGHHGWSSPIHSKHGKGWSGIKRYLKPSFGSLNEFASGGLDTYASINQPQIIKTEQSSKVIDNSFKPTKSTLFQSIYPKNWKYGHIFGTGLDFLLPRSEY